MRLALHALHALVLMLAFAAAGARADELGDIRRLHESGQSSEALRRTDALLARQPRDPAVRFLKAVVLADLRRDDEAAGLLQALADDHPQLAEPHNNLAALQARRGDYDAALASLRQAIRLNPDFAAAHENLGDVHVALAAAAYAKARALEPSRPLLERKLQLARQLGAER